MQADEQTEKNCFKEGRTMVKFGGELVGKFFQSPI
jgi:hypothetical protein